MHRKLMPWISISFRSMIVDTMKVSKWVNECQGDGFSSVGAQTVAIKLTMAGTQDW